MDNPDETALTERWHQEQIDLALEWLLLFQAGESRPLPGDNWIPVAIDALRLCGAVSGSSRASGSGMGES